MKKILSVLMIICLLMSLIGCAKCINTEYQDVEVKIVDTYRRGPRRIGSAIRPAQYHIVIEYNDSEYIINGSKTYYTYRDKVEQTVMAVLETRTYDDGTVKQRITSLK